MDLFVIAAILAAILVAILLLHDNQMRYYGSIRSVDAENLGKDTTFIIVAEILSKLHWIL